jgi:hypothetical protein
MFIDEGVDQETEAAFAALGMDDDDPAVDPVSNRGPSMDFDLADGGFEGDEPDHPRAADRRHALAEAMPPFAHQPARLIGPFHRLRSISGRRLQSLAGPHHGTDSSSSPRQPRDPGHGALN